MAEPITMQKLIDASLDSDTLGEFANEDKLVISRKGLEYPSAPMASRLLVENGLLGARPFSTYAKMIAPDVDPPLLEGDYAVVTNDDELDKNGVYQKISGEWDYLKYNLGNGISKLDKQLLSISRFELYNSYNDTGGGVIEELGAKSIYIEYSHVNKSLSVTWQHTPSMMFKSVWQPNGFNNLFNFKSISYASGSSPKSAVWTSVQDITTDYIPPITFLATTGEMTDTGVVTAGGNHSANGATTASMTQCDFYINGSLLTSDYQGIAESVQCRWTNMIYAPNTVVEQRYTLKQEVAADFSRGHVGVLVKNTALEPLNIMYEGGTQVYGKGWGDAISFYGGVTKGFVPNNNAYIEAGSKNTAPNAWAVVLKSNTLGYLAAYLDRSFGVKADLITGTGVMAARNTGSLPKFYNFTLRNQTLSTGQSYSWRGGYAYAPLDITNLESAFIAKIGNRSAIGYEALAGQKGDIKIPNHLIGNDYQSLESAPDGVYVNTTTYQTALAKEV